jgi:hypothetical protein
MRSITYGFHPVLNIHVIFNTCYVFNFDIDTNPITWRGCDRIVVRFKSYYK